MHRLVNMTPNSLQVDHINGDKLDNREANLRFCINAENCRNRRRRAGNSSGFKGVSFKRSNSKYQAAIGVDGKTIYLGLFEDPREAARAYDAAAILHHGRFALLNLPDEHPGRLTHHGAYRGKNKTGFRGVEYEPSRNKFRAKVGPAKNKFDCGRFNSAEEAARAYDFHALRIYGVEAKLNFPDSPIET